MISVMPVYWIVACTSSCFALFPMFVGRCIKSYIVPSTTHQVRLRVLQSLNGPKKATKATEDSITLNSTDALNSDGSAQIAVSIAEPDTPNLASPNSFSSASFLTQISRTTSFDGSGNQNNPARQDRVSSLLATASVVKISKRWIRRFRARKALRLSSGALGASGPTLGSDAAGEDGDAIPH